MKAGWFLRKTCAAEGETPPFRDMKKRHLPERVPFLEEQDKAAGRLALAELEALAGTGLTGLFTFLGAGIAAEVQT